MFRSLIATVLIVLNLCLVACSNGVGGLQKYTNSTQGYEFVYPNGWVQVEVGNSATGVDVVFRDLIERTENVSVVISEIPQGKTLKDLGTPSEVGYKLLKSAIAPPNSERKAELISAQLGEAEGKSYYKLEYQVKLPNYDQERHNLASVTVSRGKLFTLNVSVPQRRWEKLHQMYDVVASSFRVY